MNVIMKGSCRNQAGSAGTRVLNVDCLPGPADPLH